jgi:hypothetical protein
MEHSMKIESLILAQFEHTRSNRITGVAAAPVAAIGSRQK